MAARGGVGYTVLDETTRKHKGALMLTPRSPLPARLWGYLGERFPLAPYTVLVVLFFGSAALVSRALAGLSALPAPQAWLGAPAVLLVFLHLRVFDEHKDHARDQVTHPERLLSRGVVTLRLLAGVGLLAIGLEAGLSALVGPLALLWWALTLLFTLLMRYEFGVGGFLNQHMLLYAVTHNPVVGLLAVYGYACAGAPFQATFLLYVLAASLGSLAFELGRKLHLPDEEVAGVDSYSSVYGRATAGRILAAIELLTGLSAAGVVWLVAGTPWQRGVGLGLLALGVAWGVWSTRPDQRSKRVELSSSVVLLLSLLAMGVAAW